MHIRQTHVLKCLFSHDFRFIDFGFQIYLRARISILMRTFDFTRQQILELLEKSSYQFSTADEASSSSLAFDALICEIWPIFG